jgi:hypothetical protein
LSNALLATCGCDDSESSSPAKAGHRYVRPKSGTSVFMFHGRKDKARFLAEFRPDIFFDDHLRNCEQRSLRGSCHRSANL